MKCKNTFLILAFLLFIITPSFAIAQSSSGIEQFQRHVSIGGVFPSSILMLGFSKDTKAVRELFDVVVSKTNDVYAKLDCRNPSSEVAKINAAAGTSPVAASPEVVGAFESAKQSAEWSSGAFDITYSNTGSYRDIKTSKDKGTVELSAAGMQVCFDNMIEGFLADLLIQYLYSASMQHAIVKVGNTFRGTGQSLYGPWKVQVEDNEGVFARHALNLTVENTGVSAVSASHYRAVPLVDPRSKSQVAPSVRGVVIVMKNAASAEAISHAVFLLGAEKGLALLSRLGKGLIVDANGQFIRSPGF